MGVMIVVTLHRHVASMARQSYFHRKLDGLSLIISLQSNDMSDLVFATLHCYVMSPEKENYTG